MLRSDIARAIASTAVLGFVALPLAPTGSRADEETRAPARPPADVGLLEHVTSRLHERDVNLTRPKDHLDSLQPSDFTVSLAGRELKDFIVDRVCQEPIEQATLESSPIQIVAPLSPPAAPRKPGTTFILYFD